jgi:membrane-associated phospholipid phosphatase
MQPSEHESKLTRRLPHLPGIPGRGVRSRMGRTLGRTWGRLRRIHWPVIILAGLAAFVVAMPAPIRETLWRGIRTQGSLEGMLVLFGLLALSLLWSAGQRLDAWVFQYFNFRGRRPRWLDRTMLGCTQLGSGFAPPAIALVLFFNSESYLADQLILGSLTLALVVELAKAIFRRARPFVRLTQTRIVGYRPRGRSFPSGHTTQAFFLATFLVQHNPAGAWAGPALYGLAVLVAVTRMYVGAHYPRDVLAGAILGSVWGLLGTVIDQNFLIRIG